MSQVIGVFASQIGCELRMGPLGGLHLWIKEKCQPWDTNTGQDDGPEYSRWRKAYKEEVRDFLRNQAKNI